MSQTGLAKLCGVHKATIMRLLKRLEDASSEADVVDDDGNCSPVAFSAQNAKKDLPKILKPLLDKPLYLLQTMRKNGGAIKIVRSEVCAAVISYHAQESEVAEFSLTKFTQIGIDAWIQGITGWKPAEESKEIVPTNFAKVELPLISDPDDELAVMKATFSGFLQVVEQMERQRKEVRQLEANDRKLQSEIEMQQKAIVEQQAQIAAQQAAIAQQQAEVKAQRAFLDQQKHELEAVGLESYANTLELERFRNGHGHYFTIAGP